MPRPLVIVTLSLALAAGATSALSARFARRAARAEAQQTAQTSLRMQEAQLVALVEYAGESAMRDLATLLEERAADPVRREARDRLSLALARFDDAVRAWRKIPHDGDLSAAFAALEPRLSAWRAAVDTALQAEVSRGATSEGVVAPPPRTALLAAAQAAAAPMDRGVDLLKARTPPPWRDAKPAGATSGGAALAMAWASGIAAVALLGAAAYVARRRPPRSGAAAAGDLKTAA